MAVGAFKIVGQDGNLPGAQTLPIVTGVSLTQAALAAGGELTLNVNTSRPFFADGTDTDWTLFATVLVSNEANVCYVAQTLAFGAGLQPQIGVKIRNVGGAAGTQTFRVLVLGIPVGVA